MQKSKSKIRRRQAEGGKKPRKNTKKYEKNARKRKKAAKNGQNKANHPPSAGNPKHEMRNPKEPHYKFEFIRVHSWLSDLKKQSQFRRKCL
jgi:hypothetical protein